MNVESQDLLRAFCEAFTLQHRDKWPPNEYELAEAFVSHFAIPRILGVADLQNFLTQTNIELIEDDSPADLLGINMSVGGKRRIFTSKNRDHFPFRIHTLLHEIRELIEVEFCQLGFKTTNSQGLDSRADEFSFAVHIRAATPSIEGWVKNSPEIKSTWQSIASLFGLIAIATVFGLSSFFGAFGYRFQNQSVKKSPLRHI